MKLVRTEDGSSALQEWLDERCDELAVTSALSRAEVLRTIRRNNHRETGELIDPAALADELAEAAEVLAAVAQVCVDADILDRAGALTAPTISDVGRYSPRVRRRVGSIRRRTRDVRPSIGRRCD